MPELPAELLFSDAELRVLATFARSRKLAPPTRLGEAVSLVARLGGWLGRTRDPPGAQLMWHGYTQLAAMTFAFELRDEYGWPHTHYKSSDEMWDTGRPSSTAPRGSWRGRAPR